MFVAASLAQAGSERVKPGEAPPHSPPEELGQRPVDRLAGQQLIGHGFEDIAGREVRPQRVLGPVPPRVAKSHPHEGTTSQTGERRPQ